VQIEIKVSIPETQRVWNPDLRESPLWIVLASILLAICPVEMAVSALFIFKKGSFKSNNNRKLCSDGERQGYLKYEKLLK
jgi:hypothetical protein